MARPPAVVVALCLLAVAAGATAGATPSGAGTAFEVGQQFDRAQFRIAVHPNGSARWTFHYERRLANESEREQFEAYADRFNTNDTVLYRDFRNQSRTLAERGQAATDREMAVGSFERRAFVTTQLNDVGVVEMSFTWDGFARTEGERVFVGDVFEGGLYVGPGQSLVVRAAGGLVFQSVEPAGTLSGSTLAASDTVTWQGERSFTDNHPRVVLSSAPDTDGGPGDGTTDGGPADGRTDTATTEPASPVWPVALVLVVIVAALGAFVYRQRSSGGAAGGDGGGAPPAAPSVDEAALLNDEERIARLLRDQGGRMRQSAIVEATGWSKSKVSMVLSEMADEGEIRKLRVGRENIISLPGHEPEAAGPAHGEPPDDGE